MICLDTNGVIGALDRRPSPLRERCDREVAAGGLALPAICLFELEYGIAKGRQSVGNALRLVQLLQLPLRVLPFDREDALEAGLIRAALEAAGTPIGPYDMLIAAQARRRGAILVTANTREFARVPGLALEDWSKA